MNKIEQEINKYILDGKTSYSNLHLSEKLNLVSLYMDEYVAKWEFLEPLNESSCADSEDLSIVINGCFSGNKDSNLLLTKIYDLYEKYYREELEDKYDEVYHTGSNPYSMANFDDFSLNASL